MNTKHSVFVVVNISSHFFNELVK